MLESKDYYRLYDSSGVTDFDIRFENPAASRGANVKIRSTSVALTLMFLHSIRGGTERNVRVATLGSVDSKDSLLGANQIQGCFWGGNLGCNGSTGFERRCLGADGAP